LIILARHGESEYSVLGLMNGDVTLPVGLTETGVRQARALGDALAGEAVDLCVTSEFRRARETADLALAGRDVPRLVLGELNDPLYGPYEGAHIDAFRDWAAAAGATAAPEPGGESRVAIAGRYAAAFRALAERPERGILVVCHSLPVAYALAGREGRPPEPREPLVPYATPYRFTRAELARAAAVLEAWVASPTW
jgi:broad specificity phosphatase PhoE